MLRRCGIPTWQKDYKLYTKDSLSSLLARTTLFLEAWSYIRNAINDAGYSQRDGHRDQVDQGDLSSRDTRPPLTSARQIEACHELRLKIQEVADTRQC